MARGAQRQSRPSGLWGQPQPPSHGDAPRAPRHPKPDGNWALPGGVGVGASARSTLAPERPPVHAAEGLQMRFARIADVTPKGVLDQPLWVPAPVGDFGFEEDALFTDYDTVSAGQFSQAAGGGPEMHRQRTGQQDVLTLEWDALWLVNRGVDPDRFRDGLLRILRAKRPVELLATRSLHKHFPPELRMPITVRKVSVKMKGGEPDTRYITIQYVEARDAQLGRRTSRHPRARGKHLPTKHRLSATDTLHSLSMTYYGSYAHARDIARADHVHGFGLKTPLVQYDHWRVGQSITIPKVAVPGSGGTIGASAQSPVAVGG